MSENKLPIPALCVAVILLSGLWTLEHLQLIAPDGLTFLDMATESHRSGPGALLNPMWNPLYPGVLAIFLAVLKPSPAFEVPVMQLTNWVLFCGAAVWFSLFLRSWIRLTHRSETPRRNPASARLLVLCCFSVFAWIYMRLDMTTASTDLIVSACVFLSAWCCTEIAAGQSGWMPYPVLGIVLAIAFYSKPSGLPMAILLFIVLAASRTGAGSRRKLLVSFMCFAAAVLPLIVALSARAGHLTTSESGKLNYLWHVNDFYSFMGWTGQQAQVHGVPAHAPRVLFENPRVLEFASPVKGTYPLWFDPSYWYAGVRVQYNVRQQVAVAIDTLRDDYALAVELLLAWAGLVSLAIMAYRARSLPSLPRACAWIAIWPVSVIALFAAVHTEPRYIAPLIVLILVGAYSAAVRALGAAADPVIRTVTVFLVLSIAAASGSSAARFVKQTVAHDQPDDRKIALRLRELGLRPGDAIATAGYSFDAYYAHFAGLHIVAQAPDAGEFWQLREDRLEELSRNLRQFNVRAIVASGGPAKPDGGWLELPPKGDVPYRALLLH